METISRKRWRQIEKEFGQDQESLGLPRLEWTEGTLQVEFGDGESNTSVFATQKSTRVDLGDLSLYADKARVLLLRRIGPYPIEQWEVLYDSKGYVPVSSLTAEKTAELAQLVQLLRLAVQGYYGGQVDETDPAVSLVQSMLERHKSTSAIDVSLTERAVQIVQTVRSMVPRQ